MENDKTITLKLCGEQEKFIEKFDDCYECYLRRFWLQEGQALVTFAYYWDNDDCTSDEYAAIVNRDDKRIKLINKDGNQLPKNFCKTLNKRFSKTWSIKFI